VKNYVRLVGPLALLFLMSRSSFAQVDPTAVLVGTWDGWFEVTAAGANPARTLIIESVVLQDGGGWIAKSQFGEKGANLRAYDINVTREGDDVVLDWIWGLNKMPIRVKLVGTNKLEGNARPWRVGGGTANLSAKFEKK
jgi:hypothetical protein